MLTPKDGTIHPDLVAFRGWGLRAERGEAEAETLEAVKPHPQQAR